MGQNFIEIEFQCAVMTAYFNLFKSRSDLGIYIPSLHEERLNGADWIFDNIKGVPFYFQFKRSKQARNIRIRERRDVLHIPEDEDTAGVFEFKLYRTNNIFNQHNMLYNSSKENYAFYVAPIFSGRDQLNYYLRRWVNGKEFLNEYYYILFDGNRNRKYHYREKLVGMPFLNNIIYIKPHAHIVQGDQGHHYVYNTNSRVSFHSDPIELDKTPNTFGDFLPDAIETLKEGVKGEKKSKTLNEVKSELVKSIEEYFTEFYKKDLRRVKLTQIEKKILGLDQESYESQLSKKKIATIDDMMNMLSESSTKDTYDSFKISEMLFENIFGTKLLIMHEKIL